MGFFCAKECTLHNKECFQNMFPKCLPCPRTIPLVSHPSFQRFSSCDSIVVCDRNFENCDTTGTSASFNRHTNSKVIFLFLVQAHFCVRLLLPYPSTTPGSCAWFGQMSTNPQFLSIFPFSTRGGTFWLTLTPCEPFGGWKKLAHFFQQN